MSQSAPDDLFLPNMGAIEIEIPDFDTIVCRPLDVQRDAPMLHRWFNEDNAVFWGMQGKSVEYVAATYASRLARPYYRAWIGSIKSTGQDICLLENTDPRYESYGKYWKQLRPGDMSGHTFVAKTDKPIKNFSYHIYYVNTALMFRSTRGLRVVGEPDIENIKSLARCVQLGNSIGPVLYFPYKTAVMNIMTRADFERMSFYPITRQAVPPYSEAFVKRHVFIGKVIRKINRLLGRWPS